MTSYSKALMNIIDKLSEYGAQVQTDAFTITINIDITKTGTLFSKLKPLLYLISDKLANRYSILVEGVPYCLLPGLSRNMQYTKKAESSYRKEKECVNCKHEKDCPGWENGHKISNLPPAVRDIPNEIVLEITKRCNLKCPLCFSTKTDQEIPLSRIKEITDECVNTEIKTIRFSGGEPLFHKDIIEALYYAKSKNLYVILNTNATTLNKDTQKALADCVDNSLVSFQGFDPKSEKQLTQSPVNFKQKIHNLVELNARIPMLRLGTIISRTLLNHFDKYLYVIKQVGIRHWELYRPMLPSRFEEFRIEKNEFLWVMERLKTIKSGGFDIKIANPLPFCISRNLSLSKYVLIGALADDGHSRIVCDVEGFFKPSYFISENLGTKIMASWQNPFLQKIRSLDYLPTQCQNCSYLKWCKGGSRSLAKITSGNYFDRDPLMSTA